MNYKVTGTLEEMTALELEIFTFGGPFSAVTYGQVWDNLFDRYFESIAKTGGVSSWQKPNHEGNDVYSIIHIDMFTFSDKTIAQYVEEIPEDEENQTETQKAILERVVEGYEDYTPQAYVSEVIIGDKYNIIAA